MVERIKQPEGCTGISKKSVSSHHWEKLKEARNSFVGRAQTGFQFTRETQKLKRTNKNGVALSSGFNILRPSFKSCV